MGISGGEWGIILGERGGWINILRKWGGWGWMVVAAQFDNARLKCVEIFLITYIEFIHKNNSDYHGIGKM